MQRLRLSFAIGCGLVALAGSSATAAQTFPAKPIRIIAPFAAGGTTDILSRAVAPRLAEALGQQVIVENRPGAAGVIGAEAVAKSAPDGHTLGMINSTHAVTPFVMKSLPYDAVNDLAAVTLVALVPGLLTSTISVPARTVKEVIELAKSKPSHYSYGLPGSLTSGHLSMELLKNMTGVDIVAIPYKGAAPAFMDLISGQVHFMINSPPSSMPHIKAGKLRPIATTAAKRSSAFPDVPTIAESGFPGYDTCEWYGLFTHGKAPKEAILRISQEVGKIIRTPELTERMLSLGAEPSPNSPEEFTAFVRAEMEKWGTLAKTIGLKAE
ncbi:MAG: Bug family tripartite tricarboxylate transporter substrate binding protein [Burkholderiales bacterium]